MLCDNIWKCLRLPGDVIECGSSRCGTSIVLAREAAPKLVYACDSFSGFHPDELRHEQTLGSRVPKRAFTSTSVEYACLCLKARASG